MLRTILLPAVALTMLAACDVKPTEVGPGAGEAIGSPQVPATSTAPVKLPPSIAASKQYRCADNGLALVEWYSDDLSASVRTKTDGTPQRVVAPAKGEEMVGGGYRLKGLRTDANVMFATPEHPKLQKCHV
jgi:hypothetical protein